MTTLYPTIRKETATARKVDISKIAFPSDSTFTKVEYMPAITKENLNGRTDISAMFKGNSNIKEISFAEGSLDGVINLNDLARECLSLESIKFPSNMDSITSCSALLGCYTPTQSNKVKSIVLPDLPNVSVAYSAFYGCENLESVIIGDMGLSSSKTLSINFLFNRCLKLTNAKIGNISKANTTDNIKYLFASCPNLAKLSIKALPQVDMTQGEFTACSSLTAQSYANIFTALPDEANNTIEFANNLVTYIEQNNTCTDDSGTSKTFVEWVKFAISKGWTIKTLSGNLYNKAWADLN